MTLPSQRKEDAEVLRLALLTGLIRVADAVAWADDAIMSDTRPGSAVIDVALSGHRTAYEMAALLAAVPGVADPVRVIRRHLGDLLRVLDRDLEHTRRVVARLSTMAWDETLADPRFDARRAALLAEDYDEATWGIHGSEAAARDAIRQYLLQHAL